jgi:hypothetical protein
MKTIEQAKADLWKRFREEVTDKLFLRDEDLLRLMSDGVIFVRIGMLSGGEPAAKVMTLEQVKADPR